MRALSYVRIPPRGRWNRACPLYHDSRINGFQPVGIGTGLAQKEYPTLSALRLRDSEVFRSSAMKPFPVVGLLRGVL
jgi:hypothetical protein